MVAIQQAFTTLGALAAQYVPLASTPTNWSNVTGSSSVTFPTDVGNLGKFRYGDAPFKKQEDHLRLPPSTCDGPLEMRWRPYGAEHDQARPDDIFRNLGTATPYRAAHDLFPETEDAHALDCQCRIEQVHMLYRHGSRYPSHRKRGPGAFARRVQDAVERGALNASGDLAFLNHWQYRLGLSLLVPYGAQEMFEAGVRTYYDYGKLLENLTEHKLVVRTTSQSRMLDSARYWTLGFFGWDAPEKVNLEVHTEAEKQNSTLSPKYACPNARDPSLKFGYRLTHEWRQIYLAKAVERLQRHVQGLPLAVEDVAAMMSLCAFETTGLGYSDFCRLFTKEEWKGYEYEYDLAFQANHGFMNPTAKAQGIGWVNEFLARLTKSTQPNKYITSQNTTLNQNATYFPVDQPLYVDFTHDAVITAVLTAFNFTQLADWLPHDRLNAERRYRASRVTPLAARLVIEQIACGAERFIRVKINDAILPLNRAQGCAPRDDGLCSLERFKDHLERHANQDAHFPLACYGTNGTDFLVTGPVRSGTFRPDQILAKRTNISGSAA